MLENMLAAWSCVVKEVSCYECPSENFLALAMGNCSTNSTMRLARSTSEASAGAGDMDIRWSFKRTASCSMAERNTKGVILQGLILLSGFWRQCLACTIHAMDYGFCHMPSCV